MGNELELLLRRSRQYANDGWVLRALEELELATEHATEIGIKIPEGIVREVEGAAYRNGAELQLMLAVGYANSGMKNNAEKAVQRACKYATYAGLDISKN